MFSTEFPRAVQFGIGLRQNIFGLALVTGLQGHFDQTDRVVEVSSDMRIVQVGGLAERVLCGSELLLPHHYHSKGVVNRCAAVVDLTRALQRFERFGVFSETVITGAERKMCVEVVVILRRRFAQENYPLLQLAIPDFRHTFFVGRASRLWDFLDETYSRWTRKRLGVWIETYLDIDRFADRRSIGPHATPDLYKLSRRPVPWHRDSNLIFSRTKSHKCEVPVGLCDNVLNYCA